MEFKPHVYQEKAIQHILDHNSAGLFLDLGLGKTVATLTALSVIMHDRFEIRKPLVVAPKRVADEVWEEEIEKWDHLDYMSVSKILGTEKQRIRALYEEADLYVINRENIEWLVNYYGKFWPFDMLIVDELSSFKSATSRRFRALRRVLPFFERVVGLTATPASNGLLDLWPQMYILDQGERLGVRQGEYKGKFFEPDKTGWVDGKSRVYSYKPKPGAEKAIYRRISDICVSMSADDWLELRKPVKRNLMVRLPRQAMAHYRKLERDLLLPLDDADIVASTAAVLSNKLLQVANGAVYDEDKHVSEIHDAKLDVLDELIEAANGKPVLIFYAFKHDLTRIKKKHPDAVEFKTRADTERWNRGEISKLLVHPKSAGHGLNLQAGGSIIIWYSTPWSLELYEQANGRLQRQGQKEQVIINHIVASGTLDEEVLASLTIKEVGQDALLHAIKARIERIKKGEGVA